MRRMTKVMNLLNTVPAQCPATPPPLYKRNFLYWYKLCKKIET